ncbi:unnamed protein product [Schistosoma curassoni]|uniref:Uncharacterized protein n=1 Tax=Schistosoma curassoni TaxID=6186 RepID=A0A183JXQ5_9TREM|nr:unnamed protein product [Schistosoma curassoni]
MSQLKLDHHRKPGSTGWPFRPGMRTPQLLSSCLELNSGWQRIVDNRLGDYSRFESRDNHHHHHHRPQRQQQQQQQHRCRHHCHS